MRIVRDGITFLAGRGRISLYRGAVGIKDVPVKYLQEVISSLEENKWIDRLERMRNLYKLVLTQARGDQDLTGNRDKYLAIQGVTWEVIQEARNELPLMSPNVAKRVTTLLERVEDSNHRLDAILSTRLGVMGIGDIAGQTRDYLDRRIDELTF